MKNHREIFTERLKAIRTELRYTQTQLSEQIDVKKQSINDWEHGRAVPTFDVLVRVANFFNVSLDWLAGLSDDPKIHKRRKPEE